MANKPITESTFIKTVDFIGLVIDKFNLFNISLAMGLLFMYHHFSNHDLPAFRQTFCMTVGLLVLDRVWALHKDIKEVKHLLRVQEALNKNGT